MKKVWYVFKLDYYIILNDEFKKMETSFFIYNSKSKLAYKDSTSLSEALRTRKNRYRPSVFFDTILNGQIPLFDKYEETEYYKALPKIEVGETFADKVATYNFFCGYDDFPLPEFLELVKKFKTHINEKDSSFTITERERLENRRDKFVSITLLTSSKLKPNIEDIKKDYPELL